MPTLLPGDCRFAWLHSSCSNWKCCSLARQTEAEKEETCATTSTSTRKCCYRIFFSTSIQLETDCRLRLPSIPACYGGYSRTPQARLTHIIPYSIPKICISLNIHYWSPSLITHLFTCSIRVFVAVISSACRCCFEFFAVVLHQLVALELPKSTALGLAGCWLLGCVCAASLTGFWRRPEWLFLAQSCAAEIEIHCLLHAPADWLTAPPAAVACHKHTQASGRHYVR